MTAPVRRALGSLTVVLVIMGLGACTKGSPTDQSGRGVPGSPGTATRPADHRLTLSELLGTGGTTEDYARVITASERDRQELIRTCMARQGFTYVPFVVAGQVVNLTGLPTDLPPDQFRRRFGYGVSTGFESALRLAPADPTKAPVDPNQAIVTAMSESERAAYLRALNGQVAAGADPQGCQGEATRATDKAAALIEEFGDALGDLNTRIDADRRIVDAERAWQGCLARAGYHFSDEATIKQEINRRLNPLYDAISGEDVPEGMMILRRGKTLTASQQAMLDAVKSFELAVANADQDCRGDLDRVRRTVRAQYEADFVEANRNGLKKLFPGSGL